MIDVYKYNSEGYKKLFSYNNWRIAMLNYTDELRPLNINYFEAHNETDEVFVLLEGNAIIYYLENDNINHIFLEKNKVYNVKKGTYHTHVLSKNCKLLIIEEENTNYNNSPRIYISDKERKIIKEVWDKYEL